MKKGLVSKLKTGAAIGLTALATALPMKSDAALIYDSGVQRVTNSVPGGNLIIQYQQTINDTGDTYESDLFIRNETGDFNQTEGAYFLMGLDADLEGRGATNLVNSFNDWHWETTGADTGQMIVNTNGLAMNPGWSDNFYYNIAKTNVLGWEEVDAYVQANAGQVHFTVRVPKTLIVDITYNAINFNTYTNMSYTVYSCTNLVEGNWTSVTNFTGSGSSTNIPMTMTNSAAYYKVQADTAE